MEETVIPTFYPEQLYNGQPLNSYSTRFCDDQMLYKLSTFRLRQQRVKETRNGIDIMESTVPLVISGYSSDDAEKQNYLLGWHNWLIQMVCHC